ncbi:MAG TPA: hypothetical protein DDY78_28575 [Planctomycetales bacterium]|jgi:hypothetical protein|nr:hypothetical protein [Planctomycetales bacterium]
MRPDAIRKLLRKQPFRPFRVYVSDGAIYDVAHPEAAEVSAMMLIIEVHPAGFAGVPGERIAYISLIHVTRVEVYFPGAAPAP